ncbi:hypothetical protein UM399_12010 [Sulfitobacter pontiacus]|uniref:hypothetical protein n=1 Tax=Sulfitobacter pontiacus TaxID=60137 RepID=UPI002AC8ED6F|nr:hypothetical protein [Sulfitobacter pontiacus]WPZ24887.1 hypothetical protein UM399_12010 [Sulfitobacter pontiacus]|tara:strand:- start:60 stop:479 length:420 start_codon:yes stop_codon:yes gene_type:complete
MMTERLAAFVSGLDKIDAEDTETLKDAFMNEVIENGGSYDPPHGDQRALFEISLHDVTACGASELTAIRNWRIAATVALVNAGNDEVEADGFITVHPPFGTPRNHDEEIRNAREGCSRLFPAQPLTQGQAPAGQRPAKK